MTRNEKIEFIFGVVPATLIAVMSSTIKILAEREKQNQLKKETTNTTEATN